MSPAPGILSILSHPAALYVPSLQMLLDRKERKEGKVGKVGKDRKVRIEDHPRWTSPVTG